FSLSDTFPAGVFTSASFGTPSSGTFDSTTDVWTVNLASGASGTITLSGTVSPTATGSLINTVTGSSAADTDKANNTATDSDTLTPQADLAVTKTDGKTSVVPGTADTYTITVTNNGPSTIGSFNLSDTIPAALTGASFGTPSLGTFDSTTDVWTV